MNSETKSKVIVFGCVGIAVLIIIILIASIASGKKNKNPEGVNLATAQQDFTIDDMVKINDETSKPNTTGSLLSQRHNRAYNFENADSIQSEDVYQSEDEEIIALQKVLQANQINTVAPTSAQLTTQPVQQPAPVAQSPVPTSTPAQINTTMQQEQETQEEATTTRRTRESRFYRGEQEQETGNTIQAVVHGEQTISDKSTLKMRLLEDMRIDDIIIPRGTYVYGVVSMTAERILINIENIRVGRNIYTVRKTVYDLDGLQGINVPENVKAEITKRATAQTIQETNTHIGSDPLSRTIGSAGTATKQILNKTAQEVKVTVKSNYQIYLK